jgi:hypothetical protein
LQASGLATSGIALSKNLRAFQRADHAVLYILLYPADDWDVRMVDR